MPDDAQTLAHGLALLDAGRFDEARAVFLAVVAADPHSAAAHHVLGVTVLRQGDPSGALGHIRQALELDADQAAYHVNLANALADHGDLDAAATALEAALALDPEDPRPLCNLGGVHCRAGRLDDAGAAYRRAIALDPQLGAGHQGLCWVLAATGATAELDAAYGRWRAAAGNDVAFARDYFDGFAPEFDAVLASLGYRGDALLAALLDAHGLSTQLDVADAGCGTGGLGATLRPRARHLIGFDVSTQMLRVAEATGCYDALEAADLIGFCGARPRAFDLVVAVDVLPYLRELDEAVLAVAGALRNEGAFAFTVELADEPGAPRGDRYQHTEAEVRHAVAVAGLELAALSLDALRTEADQPVPGLVALAKLG